MPLLLPQSRKTMRRVSHCTPQVKTFRKAEVIDSLVWMIAGLLFPAWLLGHLFLAWFPAPEASPASDAGMTNTSLVEADSTEDPATVPAAEGEVVSSSDSGPDSVGIDEQLASKTNERFELAQQNLLETRTLLESTESKNRELETDLMTVRRQLDDALVKLKQAEATREATPNATFKGNSLLSNSLLPDSDNAMLNEQVTSLKNDLLDSRSRASSIASEKADLEADLVTVRKNLWDALTKLEKSEANLAAAEKRSAELASSESASASNGGSPFGELPADNMGPELVSQNQSQVAALEQKINDLNLALESSTRSLQQRESEFRERENQFRQSQLAMEELKAQNNALKQLAEKAKQNLLPAEVFRDFVSSKGSVSRMAFIRWEDDNVIVRSFANKKLYRLSLDRFSEADQQYLLERKNRSN